ncbi:hypothetical protein E4U43_003027 [Claviceps pusilla]|uniref:Uncharacterized protein n=1 Tax=Claviceps pusilla TaxID=123648 RepID=A0A9P7N5Q3_9HYPO|nr:hypothetical protein E4U43_003027 [Claviceps pusilla]
MKFSPLLTLALAAVATAQNIYIRRPRPGASLDRAIPFPVIIQTPTNGLTLQEVGLVISLLPCPGDSCPNAGGNIGTVLYSGLFDPQGTPTPQQTFNITIPGSFPLGAAELLATHFVLIGIAGELVYVEDEPV